jgi:phosphate transport system substrate-binding protein
LKCRNTFADNISQGSVDSSVKPLNAGGAAAITANVVNGSYKIARPFLLLTKKTGP